MLHNYHMYKTTVTKPYEVFLKDYPFTAKECVFTPILYRYGIEMPESVPFPSLNGIRDLAKFAGISDTAIRTAISRAKADGSILEYKDENGHSRYTIAPATYEMGMATIAREKQPEGFIVAVFSFTKDAISERSVVRETLKNYGFKRIAQNTYINGRIDTTGLVDAMRKFGLEKNLYLFHCPDIDDQDLLQKIVDLFELEKRKEKLEQFYQHMVGFLTEPGLDDDEIGRRLLYFGAIYWTECELGEPPIPQKHLPSNYPIGKIRSFYGQYIAENMPKLIQYYVKVNT